MKKCPKKKKVNSKVIFLLINLVLDTIFWWSALTPQPMWTPKSELFSLISGTTSAAPSKMLREFP